MSAPSIGGKVLDSSAVAALDRGRISAITWLTIAGRTGIVLYVPSLALVEVRAVRPGSGPTLADLVGHTQVIVEELDTAAAAAVDGLLDASGIFDALAGQVVHVARQRGWPALSDDPGRLHRLDPALEIDRL